MIREIAHFVRNAPEVMRLQKQHSPPEFMDALNAKADAQGYAEVRRELVADLSGRVLEIGCGTGSMLQYYGAGVETRRDRARPGFPRLAVAKAANSPKIPVAAGDGLSLAFSDATFDAVVLGLVLCSVPSVERVLAEAVRVLRPGGRLRALEHVRSKRAIPGLLMDMANPFSA
jgi:SAM-dependent methyltransferase